MMASATPHKAAPAKVVPAKATTRLAAPTPAPTAVAMLSRRAADDRTLSDLLSRADVITERAR